MPRGVAKKIDVKNVKGGVQVTVTDSEGNSATSGVWAEETDAGDEARRKLRFSLAGRNKATPKKKEKVETKKPIGGRSPRLDRNVPKIKKLAKKGGHPYPSVLNMARTQMAGGSLEDYKKQYGDWLKD